MVMKNEEKPVLRNREWAVHYQNYITGCQHNCKYCYSKADAVRYKRITADEWVNEKVRTKDVEKTYKKKYESRVMIPSSHDITPEHLNEAIIVLGKYLNAGNDVLIVTKPHIECIEAICKAFDMYKKQILFRFTIGSTDNSVLRFYEQNAPSFDERMSCLKHAYELGFETSVSCEPMLDYEPEKLVEDVLPYITNSVWLGKANMLIKRMTTNGITDEESIARANQLVEWQNTTKNIENIYEKYGNNPLVKWKESLKKALGLQLAPANAMDM
jgi:DNA repair photolyase